MSVISFARGMPGPDLLPIEEFADCARKALERDGAVALNYGPPGGYPPLREWIAERHGVDPGRVIVTNGSLQGFSFVARHLVKNGSRFIVEAPCYDRSLSILRRIGAEVEQIELADDGLDLDALAEILRAGDVVYTIPTFQNPSGRTLSRENRQRLVGMAREAGALIFEDDPYGELRFDGEGLPRISELAADDRVVFLSSFSKTVAPGIRTGYVILPTEVVPEIEALVLEHYVSPAIFVEAALYDFVTGGRSGATRCWTRLSGSSETAPPGAGPRAAISSGSICRQVSAATRCSRAQARRTSPSSRAPTSSSTEAARRRRASRSRLPRPRRSTRASAGSAASSAKQAPSPPSCLPSASP
jgi:2-aminoadipate transaminase